MNSQTINNHPQQVLPGIEAIPKTPDFSHEAERRIYEEALRDVPFADVYAQMVASGWYWRKAAVVAWLSMPKSERLPKYQYELAEMLGCSQELISAIKQKPEVQAQIMRLTTATLLTHKASVDAALIESASDPNYKNNQDRKTFYTLIGALKEQHELTLGQAENAAMEQMSDEELLALASLGEGEADDA